jgi:hypothetical protein
MYFNILACHIWPNTLFPPTFGDLAAHGWQRSFLNHPWMTKKRGKKNKDIDHFKLQWSRNIFSYHPWVVKIIFNHSV